MSEDSGSAGTSVDADLEAMIQLLVRMVRGMKGPGGRHGPGDHGQEDLVGSVKAAGLGPRHMPVMLQIVLNGPMAVGVLARHMALNPATVSQLVGELERGGFVERHPDERDRRRMIVSLAETQRERIERFAWSRLRPLRTTLEALGPVERAHFLQGWRTLVENLEREGPHSPPGGGPGSPRRPRPGG